MTLSCVDLVGQGKRRLLQHANFAILDSSVYIENFKTGRFTLTLLRSSWIIRCSAVVLHELRRGAKAELELQFVSELAKKTKIITPTEQQWLEAGEILSQMSKKNGYGPKKIREMAFDILIALSAREIGATLITCNQKDFAEIRKHKIFKVMYW